jgi:hypothetical protein
MTRLQVSEDPARAFLDLLDAGVTDGLPVVPPTPGRVEALLERYEGDPDAVLGQVPPRNGELTPRLAAVNAVMAGCLPVHLPVVVRALQAMLEPPFNLEGIQTTTHPAGPCVIVSGPAAREAGVDAGAGCLGPGFHANGAIGRAIHLVLRNVGGAVPGEGDGSTMGSPAKRGLCFADRDDGPWPTLAEELTGDRDASVVVVVPSEGPHNVNDHFSTTAVGVLSMVARTLANVGSNDAYYPAATPVVVLSPEHARTVAASGCSRDDARRFLAESASRELGAWSPENQEGRFRRKWPARYGAADEHTRVPFVESPDRIVLAVAGGPGKHSAVLPTPGFGSAVSLRL